MPSFELYAPGQWFCVYTWRKGTSMPAKETSTDKRLWRSRENDRGVNGAARAYSRCLSFPFLPHLLRPPPHTAPLPIVHVLLVYGEGAEDESEAKLRSEDVHDRMRCVLQASKMTKMSTTPALAERGVVLAPRKKSSKRSQCSSFSEYGIHSVSHVSDPNTAAALPSHWLHRPLFLTSFLSSYVLLLTLHTGFIERCF